MKCGSFGKIVCEVEIFVGNWSENASFADLKRQATKEGIKKLEAVLRQNNGTVVGKPKVKLIMAVENSE